MKNAKNTTRVVTQDLTDCRDAVEDARKQLRMGNVAAAMVLLECVSEDLTAISEGE